MEPEQYHRRSIRLPKYDYSQFGYYYVTICAQNRELLFKNNDIKQMIDNQWQALKNKFTDIDLDEYIIMPNHLHGIVFITRRGNPCGCPILGDIIGLFKSMTTHEYINGIKTKKWLPFNKRLWQRNYYEHIIRDKQSLNRIRHYIKINFDNWEADRNNPKNWYRTDTRSRAGTRPAPTKL